MGHSIFLRGNPPNFCATFSLRIHWQCKNSRHHRRGKRKRMGAYENYLSPISACVNYHFLYRKAKIYPLFHRHNRRAIYHHCFNDNYLLYLCRNNRARYFSSRYPFIHLRVVFRLLSKLSALYKMGKRR